MKHLLLAVLFQLTLFNSKAQGDSLQIWARVKNIGPGQATNILNGKSHISYSAAIEGSAYLFPDWKKGSVIYEEIEYTDVQLKYDMYKDELVLLHPNGLPVILFTPRVSAFTINDREYVNLTPGSIVSSETGFYEVLQKGAVELYAKRKKTINEKVHTSGVDKSFVYSTEYAAKKDGVIYRIKKESNMLDLFPEKKQAAKNMVRQTNISFGSDPEATLLMIAKYYNQSSN